MSLQLLPSQRRKGKKKSALQHPQVARCKLGWQDALFALYLPCYVGVLNWHYQWPKGRNMEKYDPSRSSSQNRWKLKMDIKHVKDYIYWLYYQYLLITCSYVLEPWERSMFHTITVTVFAMVVYTAYVFIPIHVRLAFAFFSQLFGGQPESTVSIVN